MKVLLIGCNGLLGQNLIRTIPQKGSWVVMGAGMDPEATLPETLAEYKSLDVTKRSDLEATIAAFSPDFIFNAAAITDVDYCEREPALCTVLNRDAVGWMAATGIPIVQVSSDYVFDGKSGPYRELDETGPINSYGKTKLESEQLTLAGSSKSLIVRTMTLWGKGRGAKTSFVEFVRNSLSSGKTIRIVTDQWGNPTLAEDLALSIWKLVEGGHSGLFNVVGSEWNSRFEWAQAIAAYYGLDGSLIHPCLTSDLKQAALRPLKSGLRIDKLVEITGFSPRDVSGQLKRVDELAEMP